MTQGKHFALTEQSDLVLDNLKGLARTNPELHVITHEKVVFRKIDKNKVSVLSGGGSGHEPTHAGYVGHGFLSAAVAGNIFASPSTKQIMAGLETIKSNKGTVIVVKNYTGDVIHFGLAAERAKAAGNNVHVVVVGDDVAVGRKQGGLVGRRGLAATVLTHKTAGAAAEAGVEILQIVKIAQAVADNTVTIGASLDHATVPGRAPSNEEAIGPDEMELGMGIHNEPGVKRIKPIPSAHDLVKNYMLPLLLDPNDKDRAFTKFDKGDKVVLMINNLGGLDILELYAFVEQVASVLDSDYNIVPVRVFAGPFITALNGPGVSISLLNTTKTGFPDQVLQYLDAPTDAPGWAPSLPASAWKNGSRLNINQDPLPPKQYPPSNIKVPKGTVEAYLKSAFEKLRKAEPQITRYDTVAGDGDCGETLIAGVDALSKSLKDKEIDLEDGVVAFAEIADIVEDSMGGTSGGLYAIYLSAIAQSLRRQTDSNKATSLNLTDLADAGKHALVRLFKYTRARKGDRTLVDALEPFVNTLSETKDFAKAVKAAHDGAEGTRKLEAKFGRASYVGKEELAQFESEGGLPDPGAIGVDAIFQGFLDVYNGK